MTAPLTVRAVGPEERPQFRELFNAYREELDLYRDPQVSPFDPADQRYLDYVFNDPLCQRWWGLVEGAPVGFALFRVQPHWHRKEEIEGTISEFYIVPGRRRTGYGRSLAEAVLTHMRERDAVRVKLTVLVRNEGAVGFWRSLGFNATGLLFETAFFMERPGDPTNLPLSGPGDG